MIALLASFICCNNIMAQAVYTPQDSIHIEEILQQIRQEENGNDICNIATKLTGTPYIAATLDSTKYERLIVNTRQVDCTTFVESVVALSLTASQKGTFADYCNNLQKIRYRNARCERYSDRLHYISQWVDDNNSKGIMEEIITPAHTATQELNLNFMSSNSNNYPQLKNDTVTIREISEYEELYRNIKVKYIPKELLNCSKTALSIENGDILAIVTAIEGLDVTHVGFGYWIDNRLHLIHASGNKGAVIIDPVPLYDYMKTKKKNLGIRVIRVIH